MLLSVEPPTYGLLAAGVSRSIATHQPAAATSAASPASSCHSRLPRDGWPAQRYTSANAGRTRKACSILVRYPRPSRAPVSATHRVRPDSTARVMVYAASVMTSTSSASGLSKRNIRAATGVRAMTAPAMVAAAGPDHRRTVA